MTDRELLEAAARAAGYEVAREALDGADSVLLVGVQHPWNPLIDDGDALRLAVKLGMEVSNHEYAFAGEVSDILSEAEIYQLTAPLTQYAAQARKLSALLGLEVKRRPDGLPIVTRQMLERLESKAKAQNDAGIVWSRRA